MVTTILSSPFFLQLVLPFILVFTVVFALLQKSEIFGKGKMQIDAIISLVIGLIVIAFGKYTGVIVNLMPFLAVSLVIILVFMILFAAAFPGKFELHNSVKYVIGGLAAIATVIAVLYYTGAWAYLIDLFKGNKSSVATNILFIVLIGAAIAVVIGFGGKVVEKAK